ncbi:MAG: hypothetical protein NUV81_00085 [bacterium]|nr:hypothetical protein [bacterium]
MTKNVLRTLFWFSTISLLGVGCAVQPKINNLRLDWKQLRGMALIQNAEVQSGSPVAVYKPALKRRFRGMLAPTFVDYNGSYRMNDGSSIELQMGVQGTPESDRAQFKNVAQLSSFEDGELNGWTLTTAFDDTTNRWVLRAAQADLGFQEDAYHVIECLATSTSMITFWDGCRTMLEGAQIILE